MLSIAIKKYFVQWEHFFNGLSLMFTISYTSYKETMWHLHTHCRWYVLFITIDTANIFVLFLSAVVQFAIAFTARSLFRMKYVVVYQIPGNCHHMQWSSRKHSRCVSVISDLNFASENGFPGWLFSLFSSTLMGKCWDGTWN